jgi:hypothetical protein
MSSLKIACCGMVCLLGGCASQSERSDISFLGRKSSDGFAGMVTAESRHGTQTVSGPVRRTGNGRLEVQLPGGTWVECARSCSDTLRQQTVDFWQNFGGGDRGSNPDGPGYFIWRRQ